MIRAFLTICPYCIKQAKLVDASTVTANRPGKIWLCENCDAYVGTRTDGSLKDEPLGSLANAELRAARIRAHGTFDALWMERGLTRTEAYRWLGAQLGLDRDSAHIAMLGLEDCERLIRAVKMTLLINPTRGVNLP